VAFKNFLTKYVNEDNVHEVVASYV